MANSALLTGATGLVGGHLLSELLQSPGYSEIHVLSRRPMSLQHPRLRVHVQELQDVQTLPRTSHVFWSLGSTIRKAGSKERFREIDHDLALRIAKMAVQQGAEKFLLVSSVDADPRSANFYLRVKGDLERELSALPFQAQHFFRPSILLGNRAEARPAEQFGQLLAGAIDGLLRGKLQRYRGMPVDVLAQAMVAAARSDSHGVIVHEFDSIVRLAGQ